MTRCRAPFFPAPRTLVDDRPPNARHDDHDEAEDSETESDPDTIMSVQLRCDTPVDGDDWRHIARLCRVDLDVDYGYCHLEFIRHLTACGMRHDVTVDEVRDRMRYNSEMDDDEEYDELTVPHCDAATFVRRAWENDGREAFQDWAADLVEEKDGDINVLLPLITRFDLNATQRNWLRGLTPGEYRTDSGGIMRAMDLACRRFLVQYCWGGSRDEARQLVADLERKAKANGKYVWYHGTVDAGAVSIALRGINPRAQVRDFGDFNVDPAFYVSENLDTAIDWAPHAKVRANRTQGNGRGDAEEAALVAVMVFELDADIRVCESTLRFESETEWRDLVYHCWSSGFVRRCRDDPDDIDRQSGHRIEAMALLKDSDVYGTIATGGMKAAEHENPEYVMAAVDGSYENAPKQLCLRSSVTWWKFANAMSYIVFFDGDVSRGTSSPSSSSGRQGRRRTRQYTNHNRDSSSKRDARKRRRDK